MPIYTPSDQNSDHGELTGLGDDDHPQYTTEAEAGVLAAALVAAHDADTSVHGIADTTVLATDAEVAAAVAAHVDDTTDAHDATAISYAGGTGMSATDVEAAIDELATEKANAADVVADGDAAGGVLSGTYPNPGFAVDMATQAELDAHVTDSSDAHAGTAITNTPAGGIAATTVQAAINELDSEKAALSGAVMDGDTAGGVLAGTYPSPSFAADMATQAELDAHISDATDAHAGTAITNTPAGTISATTVQAAINELDSEKAVAANAVMDGDSAGGVLAGTYPNPSFAADMATQAELDAHITDTTDAHDASAISVADGGAVFSGTDVEAVLAELYGAIAGGGIPGTIVDAKGDIIAASADDTPARLAVGSNGKILSADSGEATGLKWIDPPSGSVALDDLTDVTGSPPATGEAPVWDGDSFEYTDVATQAELDAHITDATDAHDASAISVADAGTYFAGTDVEAVLQEIGAGGSGGSGTDLSSDIHQVAHGLSVGDVIRYNGSAYVKAKADSAANAEVVGIVSVVAGADDFTFCFGGYITGLSGLSAGTLYFLSPSTSGLLTSTEPSTAGQVSKPLLLADSTTSGYFFNYRGQLLASATGVVLPTTRVFQIKVFDDATLVTTGDGKFIFGIDADLDNWNLTAAHAIVTTVASGSNPAVQIRNVTDSVDMLSTKITVDTSEYSSYTAATAPVIDTSHDDVATGDRIAIDVDVAGTGTKGLIVILKFSAP